MSGFRSRRLPLVNLDVIGTRPECVVPDGVWIEIQPHKGVNEAEYDANVEESRIASANRVRDERLKKFQSDVKRRVSKAAVLQRSNVANCHTKKMEQEIDVLYRSASAAERSTPKKNRCSYNVNPITIDCAGKISACDQENLLFRNKNKDCELENRAEQLQKFSKQARNKLAKNLIAPDLKKVATGTDAEQKSTLPGGIWGSGYTRDKSVTQVSSDEAKSSSLDAAPRESDDVETIPAVAAPEDIALTSLQEGIILDVPLSMENPLPASHCVDVDNGNTTQVQAHPLSKIPSVVHFNLNDEAWQSATVIAEEISPAKQVVSKTLQAGHKLQAPEITDDCFALNRRLVGVQRHFPPVLHPSAAELDERKAAERARWLSRRVFSDAERERTRENARMREHRIRVEKIRLAKEQERTETEQKLREQIEAVELAEEQMEQQQKVQERRRKRAQQDKKKKEQKEERFIVAMKSQLKERVEQNKIELPPLCLCASSFWQTDPMTCANNCLFYRNHDAYAKALEAVLAAVERNLDPFHKHALQRSTVSLGLVGDPEDGASLFSARRSARSHASLLENDL